MMAFKSSNISLDKYPYYVNDALSILQGASVAIAIKPAFTVTDLASVDNSETKLPALR